MRGRRLDRVAFGRAFALVIVQATPDGAREAHGLRLHQGPAAPAGRVRWSVCALLFLLIVLSYTDRMVLPILKPSLQARYGWSESGYADLAIAFQAAYGLAYVIGGRLVDRAGPRLTAAFAVTLWGVGQAAHAAFTTTRGLLLARLPLAAGEAIAFPAALAAINQWFPNRERALAIGLFNAGANVGAVVAPVLVSALLLASGWRAAFLVTGLLTFVWLVAWLAFYRSPERHRGLEGGERRWIAQDGCPTAVAPIPWPQLLSRRETWAYMSGRFLIDPVWWTVLFWLPDFLHRRFGLSTSALGAPMIAVYLLADLGSIGGGWISALALRRGATLRRARIVALFVCTLATLPIGVAAYAPGVTWTVLAIGVACAGHQGFSTNLYATPGDFFPRHQAGSVIGLGGLSGAAGAMLMALFAGRILQRFGGYGPIFGLAAACYVLAFLAVTHLTPKPQASWSRSVAP